MKPKPTILIGPSTQRRGAEFSDASISLSNRYPEAILAGGGVPWVLPCLPAADLVCEAVGRAAGVLLTGGDDIQPELYASRVPRRLRQTVREVSPERDLFELLLVKETLRQRKPLLGICRGQQFVNVALGGDLIVDIASEVPGALRHNRQDRKAEPVHEVTLTSDSFLATVTGKATIGVNSTHHQAVQRVAPPLRVTARSGDGIIEALELKPEAISLSPFLVTVQFHPERLYDRYDEFLELFRGFIRACAAPGGRSR